MDFERFVFVEALYANAERAFGELDLGDVVGQVGRYRRNVPFVHHHPVGEPAAAHQAEHPVAGLPAPDSGTGGGHHAERKERASDLA